MNELEGFFKFGGLTRVFAGDFEKEKLVDAKSRENRGFWWGKERAAATARAKGKGWSVEYLHSHLSRDKAAAKMGHPAWDRSWKEGPRCGSWQFVREHTPGAKAILFQMESW
jgi:hypothetical protein